MSRQSRHYHGYHKEDEVSLTDESNGHYDPDIEMSQPSSPETPPLSDPPKTKSQLPKKTSTHHYQIDQEKRQKKKRGPPSITTVESLSTIPNSEGHHQEDVRDIYEELNEINERLKREFRILHQRDMVLKQKEKSLNDLQLSLNTAIDNEVKRRLSAREQEFETELTKLEDALREKTKENRRLKENFDALKNANDILRKELDTVTQSMDKLEKQYRSVQARFINLQRRKDPDEKRKTDDLSGVLPADLLQKINSGLTTAKDKSQTGVKRCKASSSSSQEVIALLLEWVSETQLRLTAANQPTKLTDSLTTREQTEDRCFKMLPSAVELVREQTVPGSRITLPCLQFIYWSLTHLEGSQSQHLKTSLSSTLRRLGEDLYRGRSSVKTNESDTMAPPGQLPEKHKETLFFKSNHLHTRLLSGLIILKSLTQVDYLARVYETLRNDLKSDSGKEFFLYYQATPIMLHHLKPSHKALTNSALDIYLQMSMDSPYLRNFLDSCSNENWFQTISLVWKMPGIEAKQYEKMSIILQKLSKIRLNKKYFEVFGLTASCQELQRSSVSLSPFLSLNLKSIIFNLGGMKAEVKGEKQ